MLSAGSLRTISFFFTPPEEMTSMAWKIPTASCATCGSAGLTLKTVTFRLRWFSVCTAQAQVSVVGAKLGATCLEPDTMNVLCPPMTYSIAGIGNATVLHTLAFAPDCCVSGDAFVLIRFEGLGACAGVNATPGLGVSTAACVPCEQFITATHIYPDITEFCSIGSTQENWVSIDADCCMATPTRPKTWGSLKLLYR